MPPVSYYESCPDCDSLNVEVVSYEYVESRFELNVLCRDCGSDWIDWSQ